MLISYPRFHISAGLSQLDSFNGLYFNQFDWLVGLVSPLLYIFVWWLVFRINPNRSSNSVVCNFFLSSLLHKTILGRYVSVQKGYGSVCNFRFVPGFVFLFLATTSVYLYLPYHLPTPSRVNLVSVSRRSCLNFSGRVMITNFAFSYCGWANNSTVTLSLPPGRHD